VGKDLRGRTWRKGQRGGTAGVEKCLNGRTWRKVKRRSGWSGGMDRVEEWVKRRNMWALGELQLI